MKSARRICVEPFLGGGVFAQKSPFFLVLFLWRSKEKVRDTLAGNEMQRTLPTPHNQNLWGHHGASEKIQTNENQQNESPHAPIIFTKKMGHRHKNRKTMVLIAAQKPKT